MQMETWMLSESARLSAYIADAEYEPRRQRPGIILAPGGGYLTHTIKEKEAVALAFLAKGYNVFLLEYSVGFSTREEKESGKTSLDTPYRFPRPLDELFTAIHDVKQNAGQMYTDSSRLFLMGFSAGAHVCAAAGVFWNTPAYTCRLPFTPREQELKAAGMILCYPLLCTHTDRPVALNQPEIVDVQLLREFLYQTREPTREQIDALDLTKHVNQDTIPAFIWHSVDDPLVDARASTRLILALQDAGIDCEYHLYDHGGHGLALANPVCAQSAEEIQPDIALWSTLADGWMSRRKSEAAR